MKTTKKAYNLMLENTKRRFDGIHSESQNQIKTEEPV